MYFTIAHLDIPAPQMQWIQDFRRKHDPQFSVVHPHFTLVFGLLDVDEAAYLGHVAAVARTTQPIAFCCRYAMLYADSAQGTAHIYLVPNEGHAEIALLHDQLYRGPLQPHLRLDLPYVPHVTIGATQDVHHAKQLCDDLNHRGVQVQGHLTALTVGSLMHGKFQTLHSLGLTG